MSALFIVIVSLAVISMIGAVSATVKRTVTTGSNSITDGSSAATYTGGLIVEINKDFAIGTDQNLGNVAIDKDTLKLCYLLADTDMTLETNSSSSPANTIELTAGVAFLWTDDMPSAGNPFAAADVTAIYVTNAAAGNLRGYILHGAV
jgi:hypothetical protein